MASPRAGLAGHAQGAPPEHNRASPIPDTQWVSADLAPHEAAASELDAFGQAVAAELELLELQALKWSA